MCWVFKVTRLDEPALVARQGDSERSVPIFVEQVNVSAVVEKDLDHVHVAQPHTVHERSLTRGGERVVDVAAKLDEVDQGGRLLLE